jgi:membrane protein DedA with SNARE-associated domain
MSEFSHLVGDLEGFVQNYGVLAVTVILTLEALGFPVPGESLLIFSALMASRHELSLPALLVSAWAGSVMGDNIGYFIGRKVGRAAITRYGAKVGLTPARFDKIEGVFARYGAVTVIFARFVNVLRQLNGVVAGTLGMHWLKFLAYNAIGAALWVSFWVLVPYYLGGHHIFAHVAQQLGWTGAIVAIAVVVVLAYAGWRYFKARSSS